MNFKTVEITLENEKNFLEQIANLEQAVLKNMESNGQQGLLFPTGKEGISEYVHSKENTVLVIVDENNKVLASTYITQGQKAFTYNDITKYFKCGSEYQKYVKQSYKSQQEYQRDMLDIYEIKIKAFKYAANKVLEQFPQYNGDITLFLKHELEEENNHFHEKSELREMLNMYMSSYIDSKEELIPGIKEKYEKFYWITAEEISQEFGKNINSNAENIKGYESYTKIQKEDKEYKDILKQGPLVIYEQPDFDISQYYTANTQNAVELDTYITDPNDRRAGLARILLLDGIKKHMNRHFENSDSQEIFLCSTLHRDNLSSKYVSEFFGLKDNLYVKRRDGRNREVHICNVAREDKDKYLEHMEKKIAVLYNYNPNNIKILQQEKLEIYKEQLEYETNELNRINTFKMQQGRKYKGEIDYSQSKINKIDLLKSKYNAIKKQIEENQNIQEERE